MNPQILSHLKDEKRYEFVAGDVLNGILLLKTLQRTKPDIIVHFAASTHVDRSFLYPEEFFQANTQGTFTLLEALRNLDEKPRLLYISTDEVFGDVPDGFCKETDTLAPRNPYSASKTAAEMFVNAYFHSYNILAVVARLMNNYGPRQHPEKLIGKIITRCLTDTPFTLFQGGSTRGWIYVQDSVRALDLVAREGRLGEVYHIPPNAYKTVPEVAEAILTLMDKQSLFQGFKGTRQKDDDRYALDGSKLLRELRFKHLFSFEEGLKQTIEWFKKNEWFWRDVSAP